MTLLVRRKGSPFPYTEFIKKSSTSECKALHQQLKNRLAWNIFKKLPAAQPCTGFIPTTLQAEQAQSYKTALTIVTTATEQSFKDLSEFVDNLDKTEPTLPIVVYDMGLSQKSLQLVKTSVLLVSYL